MENYTMLNVLITAVIGYFIGRGIGQMRGEGIGRLEVKRLDRVGTWTDGEVIDRARIVQHEIEARLARRYDGGTAE